jgi:hypothetical protein
MMVTTGAAVTPAAKQTAAMAAIRRGFLRLVWRFMSLFRPVLWWCVWHVLGTPSTYFRPPSVTYRRWKVLR